MTDEGVCEARHAQLVLYPKYPEVRLSGFLKNASGAPAELLKGRMSGRVLFFGVCPDHRILTFATGAEHPATIELLSQKDVPAQGVFLDLNGLRSGEVDTRGQLIRKLALIHQKGWIESKRLNSQGVPISYQARNAAGLTLEAELGIIPNAKAQPDILGWELKQYGVRDFKRFTAKSPVTLFTPAPTGGISSKDGIVAFMKRYGYPDRNGKPDRLNFGGKYVVGGDRHHLTGLRLVLDGYDQEAKKITDMDGNILLLDPTETVAASWGFRDLLSHWNRKHAKAAFVPSLMRGPPPVYKFGSRIELCEGTDFLLFLAALSEARVYFDPGVKLEGISTLNPTSHARYQFRIAHKQLSSLYHKSSVAFLDA
ncbi:MvaI/BcnI family restriction endonuclease [Parasphingopyxis sp. CP4]|uniref:MvaI/BcnI family restriction endonuclease n=1 Tax=Parasphingopyxis sp. CP4 TaxID=2724527 RepID=UPI001C40A7E9|nr:MvaI/BcnI family restriction endonuclease [Parasphingopyxis sp. CP4]